MRRLSLLTAAIALATPLAATQSAQAAVQNLNDIQTVVVIYMENWSFDGLFARFPGIFNNFGDQAWSAYGFDTGIRIFETGAVIAVPEPETFALTGLGLLALIGERRRRLRTPGTRA